MKKKSLIFKNTLVALMLLCLSYNAKSQPLFVENFNFPVRDSLENTGTWFASGPVTNKNVKVISPGLSYTGYLGSGIGNNVFFSNQPDGDVVLSSFNVQISGTVYLSFLIRVDSLSASATEGFNICLDEGGGSTNLNTKIYIKKINSSTFNIGIKKCDGIVKYSPAVYSKNTTYLVMCSYTFVSGLNNDISRLYVSTSGVPATEPAAPATADTSGVDIDDIGEICLNNSFIQSGLQGSSVKIDGIRIGTSWSSTLFQQINLQLNLKALIQGFYKSATGKMIKDTATVYLRYKTSPFTIADSSKAVLDSLGTGSFVFNRIGNWVPYYIVVKHRNTIETWSYSAKYFDNNSLSFDFTPAASWAYGSNQILSGTKYCLYSGDVNQDGISDASDVSAVDNDASVSLSGYVKTDLTGDNFVDAADASLVDNNSLYSVSVIRP
ncbi:MAG: hypothetical protein IPG78_09405 [Ignavibacteria bacterium]|nr:hypothetical protein [Ignavibacteria bacterium]